MSLFHSLALPAPLWADMNKFRNMGSQFRGPRAQVESDEIITGTILLLALVVVIYILWRVAARHERHGAYDNPRRLFQQLCKSHGLDRRQRHLLKRIARFYRLTQPAQLFLEPGRFEQVNLGSQFAGEQGAVAQLRQLLFADITSQGSASDADNVPQRAQSAKATNLAQVTSGDVETSRDASLHGVAHHA